GSNAPATVDGPESPLTLDARTLAMKIWSVLVSSNVKRTPRTLERLAPEKAPSGILAVIIIGCGRGPAPLVSEPTGPVSDTKSCSWTGPETALPFPVMSSMEKLVEVWNCGPGLLHCASWHCLETRKSSVLNDEKSSGEAASVWKNT